jgi:hypothetical protein
MALRAEHYVLRASSQVAVLFCFSKSEDAEVFAKCFRGARRATGGGPESKRGDSSALVTTDARCRTLAQEGRTGPNLTGA